MEGRPERIVRAAAQARPKAGLPGRRRDGVEAHFLPARGTGTAVRASIHPGGADGVYKTPIACRVADGGDGPTDVEDRGIEGGGEGGRRAPILASFVDTRILFLEVGTALARRLSSGR